MGEIEKYNESVFENIKNINEYDQEFWYARDLQQILEYKRWDKFLNVIEKAKIACKNSNYDILDHFSHVGKMVKLGSGAQREIDDIMLSRYACYLIVQNADPRKEVVALGQTYFAVQTRKQELQNEFELMDEDRKRLAIRNELKEHNKKLVEAAHNAGVKTNIEYAIFQNHGYMGLYGGLTAKDIHIKKGLKKSQQILDHMGSTELAANLFRATQTEEKLRRENIKGKDNANNAHFEVGAKVRQTIKELGGTMPEDLPTPQKSIKQIEREEKKKLKLIGNKKKLTSGK
ncbi:DNA damage-inducible protein D [Tepidibacter formicigenes]|jgi:DNA-damage-inducible protein D|uniref:DNA-damage-inducible protein D n=1 Tax=Tepidibacter formicigenes DSM 15518 TaxID=1123349 RepID=A0A1M6JN54_9FIRM|nr:DNA damage-inducible protein D [Tepidibacter formicigenes]SHJ48068.1 DNA-damage-inducible protein D [Tepidibacter formicigenes DSM 15518]